jgi:hypothetical protein
VLTKEDGPVDRLDDVPLRRAHRARATRYEEQFRRVVGWSPATGTIRRRRGEFPNRVMFSWYSAPPAAVGMDFDLWHIVLNSVDTVASPGRDGRFLVKEIGARDRRGIFKPSWALHRWALKARRDPGSVQAVAPELDLRTADEIWCRNGTTRKQLAALGFESARIAPRAS